jgi:hypothetical protein
MSHDPSGGIPMVWTPCHHLATLVVQDDHSKRFLVNSSFGTKGETYEFLEDIIILKKSVEEKERPTNFWRI